MALYSSPTHEGNVTSLSSLSISGNVSHYQRRRHLNPSDNKSEERTDTPGYQLSSNLQPSIKRFLHLSSYSGVQRSSTPDPGRQNDQSQITSVTTVLSVSVQTGSGTVEKNVTKDADRHSEVTTPPNSEEDTATTSHFSEDVAKKDVRTTLGGIERHPGAIMQIYRKKEWSSKTPTDSVTAASSTPVLEEHTLRRIVSSLMPDIIAGIQDRWWVRDPGSFTKGPAPQLRQVRVNHKTPTLLKQPTFITKGTSRFNVQRRHGHKTAPKRKKTKIPKTIPRLSRKRKSFRTRKGQGHIRHNHKHSDVKSKTRRTLEKKRKCKYSVLSAEDVEEEGYDVLETLKKMYKNDVWS